MTKTFSIQELIDHAKQNDPTLLDALKTARSPEAFVAAARALGYAVAADDVARRAPRGGRRFEPLSEQDLRRVSGGMMPVRTTASWTFGVECCWC